MDSRPRPLSSPAHLLSISILIHSRRSNTDMGPVTVLPSQVRQWERGAESPASRRLVLLSVPNLETGKPTGGSHRHDDFPFLFSALWGVFFHQCQDVTFPRDRNTNFGLVCFFAVAQCDRPQACSPREARVASWRPLSCHKLLVDTPSPRFEDERGLQWTVAPPFIFCLFTRLFR